MRRFYRIVKPSLNRNDFYVIFVYPALVGIIGIGGNSIILGSRVKDYKDDANRSMEAMKEDLGHRIDGTMAAIKEGRSESNANSKRLEDHMDRNSARLEDYVRELNRDVKGILSDQGALKERVGRQHEELKKAQ